MLGEDVVFVGMQLDGVVGVIDAADGAHVGLRERIGGGEDSAVLAPNAAGDQEARGRGEHAKGLIRLPAKNDIGPSLLQRGFGGGRSVRPDEHGGGPAVERLQPLLGDAQLRLGAAPKEVGRSGGNDQKFFSEGVEARANLAGREILHKGVDQQDLVAGLLEEGARGEQLDRQVRLLATEVG